MKNQALGRGLSYLLKEEVMPVGTIKDQDNIDIDLIEANENQPRKHFNQNKIVELANSIMSYGLLQPIIVTRQDNGKYKIVAGERRFRACKIASLKQIPVIIKKLSDKEIVEIALIENIQRQELTAIEEAETLQTLIDEYNYSNTEIGFAIGKSRSYVSNLLRLNTLPKEIKTMINAGQLSAGHARCLIGLENAEDIAAKVIANDLNVRQTEELVNNKKKNDKIASASRNPDDRKAQIQDEDTLILSQCLSEKFGVKVVVEHFGNKGKISLLYNNLEEMDSILIKLG